MEYRRAGKSGLSLSALSIGGWLTFGGSIDDDATSAILKTSIDAGVNFIDLADVYARGGAERAAGKFLKAYKRSDLVISSKVFWPMSENVNDKGLGRKHIMESIDRTTCAITLGRSFRSLFAVAIPARGANSVATSLGLICITRTLCGRSSARQHSVSPRSANLPAT